MPGEEHLEDGEARNPDSEIQRQAKKLTLLAGEIQTLTAALELERANRLQAERQLAAQTRQLKVNLAAEVREANENAAEILNSRIWRLLVGLASFAGRIRFLRAEPTKKIAFHKPAPPETDPIEEQREPAPAEPFSGSRPKRGNTAEWRDALRSAAGRLPPSSGAPPLFTIITPAYNTPPEWLAEAALSVLQQTLADWEWRIIDDGSDRKEFHSVLEELAGCGRVVVHRFDERRGISAASNAGLQMARGTFVCFLDHDDALDPEALRCCAAVLEAGFDAAYTDHDKIGDDGELYEPFHKPDWSPEYFRSLMYVCHLLCVRREMAQVIGGFDSHYDRIQDFEFLLRYSEKTERIAHVNRILYHWRAAPGSVASNQHAKGNLEPLKVAALQAHLDRMNFQADAQPARAVHAAHIMPRSHASGSDVTVIVPTGGGAGVSACLFSLSENTTGRQPEVLCVHTGPCSSDTFRLIQNAFGATCLFCEGEAGISAACNFGASHARGRYLMFLDTAVEVLNGDWLEHLLYYADQDDVGAVGGLVLSGDLVVQQAGIALSPRLVTTPMWAGQTGNSPGGFAALGCAHEVSAVSATCLMMRKDVFEEAGGFDSAYATSYHDVDLCLRLLSTGRRNIFTPHARFLNHKPDAHPEGAASPDRGLFAARWRRSIDDGDRYYRAQPQK